MISTTPTVICSVINKQHWSHKCGCRYIHYNSAPYTHCDGGVPLATQNTHFRLILCLILRGGRVALVSPNVRRDMLPWSVGGVTDLPPDAKLSEMQQNAIAPEGWGPKEGGDATSPCIVGGPQQRRQNQKTKPTLRVTMMLLVSQSVGL